MLPLQSPAFPCLPTGSLPLCTSHPQTRAQKRWVSRAPAGPGGQRSCPQVLRDTAARAGGKTRRGCARPACARTPGTSSHLSRGSEDYSGRGHRRDRYSCPGAPIRAGQRACRNDAEPTRISRELAHLHDWIGEEAEPRPRTVRSRGRGIGHRAASIGARASIKWPATPGLMPGCRAEWICSRRGCRRDMAREVTQTVPARAARRPGGRPAQVLPAQVRA